MYAYIKDKYSLTSENSLIIYGTSSYHVIWENMCKQIFEDKLNFKLNSYFPDFGYTDETLSSIIEKPKWILDNKEYGAEKSLIPDIITFYKKCGKYDFIIFDAKYYVYELKDDKIYHQPGIRSVTKQYLYQLAYKDFINTHRFCNVKNAFLLPSDGDVVENTGYVVLNMLSESLDLENIQVVLLPAHEVNQLYLAGETMDINILKLYENNIKFNFNYYLMHFVGKIKF